MISWSPDRVPAKGGLLPGTVARSWSLDDLRLGGGFLQPALAPNAEAVREQELDAAYRRGRAEGEQSAHARARREVETALAAAHSVVREARAAQAGWNRVLEENLAALASAVAVRLVQREIACDPQVLRGLVHEALAAFPPRQEVRIRLNPADLAVLDPDGADPEGEPERDVRWVADDAILPGGCLLEGPDRIVDGRLDEGLKRIYRGLADG